VGTILGKILCAKGQAGGKQVYTLSRPEAKKLILVIRVLSSILDHATDAGFIELPVTSKDGKLFIASNELQNTSGIKGKADGAYKLKVQICDPSCP
jgi:hypothetical protein